MIRILSLIVLLLLLPNMALAMEVTSPFGWRTHPISGDSRFHSGVDIGGDYGDAIASVMPGTVSFAGWYDGYGQYVSIWHEDGSETAYAHCAELYVNAGDPVNAGQTIAALGSTGNSTGPHLHLEYLVHGVPIDPLPILMAAGWDLTYGGAPAWDGGTWANSDYHDMPYDFGDFYDIAVKMREILEQFTNVLLNALGFLTSQAMELLQLLVVIDFAIAALLWALNDESKFDFANFFTAKIIRYGFFVWLVANWRDFALSWILKSVVSIGALAGGSPDAIKELSDPSRIVQKGISLLEPLFSYVTSHSGLHQIANIHHVIVALILGALIFASYLWIGLQFFLAYLEFYFVAIYSLILVPWGVEKHLKFIGCGGIGGVVSQAIRIMAMTFVIAIVLSIVTNAQAPTYDHATYLRLLFSSLGISILIKQVSTETIAMLGGKIKL